MLYRVTVKQSKLTGGVRREWPKRCKKDKKE